MGTQANHSLEAVKNFWNTHPLFAGESSEEPGTKEWFLAHEAVYNHDCFPAGKPDAIFMEGLHPGMDILDVGCGPGYWVRYFLHQGLTSVSACDITPAAVALTIRSLELFGLQTEGEIVEGNAESLPFTDASFDHINCQGVIHHTPDTEQCIREFFRVLRPGGTVCFSVYYKNFLLYHPALLRLAAGIAGKCISLKGRGRENLLQNPDPDEVVRRYDGVDNPIGKSFTKAEALALLSPDGFPLFKVERSARFFFPARALPIPLPKRLHRVLHTHCGLLFVVRARKNGY